MDVKEIRERLQAERTFDHTVGAIKFRVHIPAESRVTRAYTSFSGPAAWFDAMNMVALEAVVGMTGASTADLRLPGDPAPLLDSPESIALLLEERQDIATELGNEINARLMARREAIEADRKN